MSFPRIDNANSRNINRDTTQSPVKTLPSKLPFKSILGSSQNTSNSSLSPEKAKEIDSIFQGSLVEMQQRVAIIEQTEGNIEEILLSLSTKAKMQVNEIQNLRIEIDEERSNSRSLWIEWEATKTDLSHEAQQFSLMLRNYSEAFDYFEGPGQFDEIDPEPDGLQAYQNVLKKLTDALTNLEGLAQPLCSEALKAKLKAFAERSPSLFKELNRSGVKNHSKKLEIIKQLKRDCFLFEGFLHLQQKATEAVSDISLFDTLMQQNEIENNSVENFKVLYDKPTEQIKSLVIDFLSGLKKFTNDRIDFQPLDIGYSQGIMPYEESELTKNFENLKNRIEDLKLLTDLDKDQLEHFKKFIQSNENLQLLKNLVFFKDTDENFQQLADLQKLFSNFSALLDVLSPPVIFTPPTKEDRIIESIGYFYDWLKDIVDEQRLSLKFDQRWAYKTVYAAFDDYFLGAEGVIEKYNSFHEQMLNAFFAPDYQASNKLIFSKFNAFIEEFIASLETSLTSYEELNYKEIDTNTEITIEILYNEVAKLSELKNQCEELAQIYESYHKKQEELKTLEKRNDEVNERSFAAQKRLITALEKLNEKSTFLKEEPGVPQDLKTDLEKLINLLRKKRLQDLHADTDGLEKLEARKNKCTQSIEKSIGQKKDPIDDFIEWTRLERKIYQKTQGQLDFIKKFPSQLAKQKFKNDAHCVFVNYTDLSGSPKKLVMNSDYRSPIDAPLIHLISSIGVKALKLADFLHFSEKGVSRFERGLMQLADFSLQKLIDKSTYREFIHKIEESDTYSDISEITGIPPSYYDRFRLPSTDLYQKLFPTLPSIEILQTFPIKLVMSLAHAFLDDNLRKQMDLPSGHPIVCIIFSQEGEILSWAVNTIGDEASQDIVRHAEVNALNIYFKRNPSAEELPKNATLVSSLKPCCMCAGAIFDSINKNSNVKVVYCQNDPGENAKTTILEREKFPVSQATYIKDGMDWLQELNKKYEEIKKKDPKINAAASLHHNELKDLTSRFNLELKAKDSENPYLEYINEFLKVNGINL